MKIMYAFHKKTNQVIQVTKCNGKGCVNYLKYHSEKGIINLCQFCDFEKSIDNIIRKDWD